MNNIKLLVIDDSPMAQRMIVKSLKKLEINNYTLANDGQSGITRAEEALKAKESFDLILCDWNMPEMDGLEFVQQMKAHAVLNRIPIIMVTTETEKDKIMAAVKAGISHYVVKPFSADSLKSKISEVLNLS